MSPHPLVLPFTALMLMLTGSIAVRSSPEARVWDSKNKPLRIVAPLMSQEAKPTQPSRSQDRPEWDRKKWQTAPKTYPAPPELNRTGLQALFYDGLPWKGKPTRVFAWVGIPDHKPGERVPGVVLIHGGGGTASDGGVRLWMKRGYAAISMDTTGSYPGRNLAQHPDGGPRGNGECFAQIKDPVPDQWMYHAVADVALANSLLRSLPDVDPNKIGLTGLSWGGVVAGVVAGVDDRFKWVAPVYGCGFLQESEYFAPVLKAYEGDKWTALWDPAQYLPKAKMPTLWINGTNDEYFQIAAWQRSYRLTAGPRVLSLKVRMPHSGPDGEKPDEILAFAESIVRGGEPLPKVGTPKRDGANVSILVNAAAPLAKAEIAFTRDTEKWSKRRWETNPATITEKGKNQTVTGTLPPGTAVWYLRVEDARGRNVTTDFEELQAPIPAPAPLPGNTVYVSPSGNDANPGTEEKPIATLVHARDLARVQPRTSPVRVVLRGGVYRLITPLELSAADSGTEAAPVIWTAAPGEAVTISGGVVLSGWKATKVNGKTAWSLTLPEVRKGTWYFRGLFGGNLRRQRARLPNTGFFEVESVEKRKAGENNDWLSGRDRFIYRAGDLTDFPDKSSTEAVLLTQWCDSHLPVTSIDTGTRSITFGKFTIQNFGGKAKYWVENTRAALDEPGEWCLNRETGELLYLPRPGETPTNTTLIAPRAPALVTMKQTANVSFRRIIFSHNDWWFPSDFRAEGYNSDKVWAIQQAAHSVPGAIHADTVSNTAFEDCEFSHLGTYGVAFAGASKNNRILRSDFYDLGAGGVRIGPARIGKNFESEVAIGNVVSDCRIYDGGKRFFGAVGIWVGQAQKTEIVHNEIFDHNYTGISCGWTWGFNDPSGARDNIIAWNHIYNIGRGILGDGAGIYMLGTQPGTVIEGNVVHDMNGTYASRGIYLDDGSSEMTIRNNLSYRNKTANYFQWKSKNNRVENNIFALGRESQVELGGAVFNGGAPAMNFTRNIIVTGPGPFLNAFNPGDVKSIYTFERNLFWNPEGKAAIPENAKAVGWNAHSMEADPLFVDLAKLDFRLREDSPALKDIGFVPVDWSKAGPRGSYRKR